MDGNSVISSNEPNQSGQGDQKTVPSSVPNEGTPARKRPNARTSQRRTKTGCLTCRQRRIKCGEERPICANCIKSKRKCEGYNPRVIFKDPLNMFRGPTSSIPAHSGFIARTGQQHVFSAPYAQVPPLQTQSQTLLPNILPRTQSFQPGESSSSFLTTQFQGLVQSDRATFPSQQNMGACSSHGPNPGPHGINQQYFGQWQDRPNIGSMPHQSSGQHGNSSQFGPQSHGSMYHEIHPPQASLPNPSYFPNPHLQMPPSTSYERGNPNIVPPVVQPGQKKPRHDQPTQTMAHTAQQIPESKESWIQMPHPPSRIPHEPITGTNFYSKERHGMPNILDDREEEEEEDWDDPYDVSSDEDQDLRDFEDGLDPQSRSLRRRTRDNNNLATVMAIQAAHDSQNTRIRTYHSVIENYGPDMLANYYPSSKDSPLSDPITASIFCHFINVIAPSITMYERHPANPSLLFQGKPVPKSQQHIWAYTMPTIALRNHALLHAMLAMASLHIAKLQNSPIMASLKHYHLAIRKLAKDVGLPTRRKQLATLATTLLLGYYEVMSADHGKWCDHLLGAQQLIKQIDFAGMTKYLKRRKMQTSQLQPGHLYDRSNALGGPSEYQDEFAEGLQHSIEDDVDENFVGILMGKKLRYAEYGEILEDTETPDAGERNYTQRDLDIFATQRDLFWWYLKQDALQSILSQNRLFLSYDRWSHCSPRAPVGRRDAVHGTFDHLVLLLGRLAEFAAKDLRRKKKVVQANGGHWRPPPGMQMPGPPPNMPGGPMQGPPGQGPPGHGPPGQGPPNHGPPGQGPPGYGPPSQGPPGYGPPGQGPPGQGPPGHGPPGQGPPGQGPPGQGPQGPGPPISMIPSMPPFAGMLPTTRKAILPRGFSPTDKGSPTPSSEDDDSNSRLDDQTAKAEEEWLEIRSAFTMLAERFGPDFEPLGPEYVQAIQSPFGPAIQYRTYSIAVIWVMYYMGIIICHRAHPSMPPAAMVAAGIAARQTAFFANEIGRISAGVGPDAATATSVNLGTGAGLTDSSFALFVAGVQLQHPGQRRWIIERMLSVERLTGWESASQCAKGCETSWIRAAEMGRGPPYTRYSEPAPVSDIWNRAGRRIDRMLLSMGETTHVHPQDTAISGRVQFALGLIGVEEKLEDLELQSDDEEGDGHD